MDSKLLLALMALFGLAACQPAGTITWNDGTTTYWYQEHITADNAPDVVKSQDLLEKDLAQCGYLTRVRNHYANLNDPVSTANGHVVDEKGKSREDAPLPTVYEVSACMEGKGWVRLKHYYTTPY